MIQEEQTDAFDLPEHCEHDRVVIYPNKGAPKQPPFVATPFDHTGQDDLGNDYYEEPEEWHVTKEYREAVEEATDIPLHLIRLGPLPTAEPTEENPL